MKKQINKNRCTAITWDGERCCRPVSEKCKEEYCWQHCSKEKRDKRKEDIRDLLAYIGGAASIIKIIEYIIEIFGSKLDNDSRREIEKIKSLMLSDNVYKQGAGYRKFNYDLSDLIDHQIKQLILYNPKSPSLLIDAMTQRPLGTAQRLKFIKHRVRKLKR